MSAAAENLCNSGNVGARRAQGDFYFALFFFLPAFLTKLLDGAVGGLGWFKNLIEGLVKIGERAFEGCVMLEELILPESVEEIDSSAFIGCESLVIKVKIAEEDIPKGWAEDWFGDAEVVWEYVEEPEETETDKNNNNIFNKHDKKEDEE